MPRLFLRTLNAIPDISTFFLRLAVSPSQCSPYYSLPYTSRSNQLSFINPLMWSGLVSLIHSHTQVSQNQFWQLSLYTLNFVNVVNADSTLAPHTPSVALLKKRIDLSIARVPYSQKFFRHTWCLICLPCHSLHILFPFQITANNHYNQYFSFT